jgi:hypothetical protein
MIPAPPAPDPCEHVNTKNVGPDPDGGGPDRIYCRDCDTVLDPATIVTWVPCDCCGDYLCNYHDAEHAFECDCPAIDQWAEHGLNPYFEEPFAKVAAFLDAVKFEEDPET